LFSKQQNFIYEEEEEKQTKPMSRIMISDDDSIGHVFSFMSNKRQKKKKMMTIENSNEYLGNRTT